MLSAVIITYNEERNIDRCLQSLQGLADEIIVVDSGSADQTCAIAARYGAQVIQHVFEGYAAQKNFAASCASYEWVLSLDADEAVSGALKKSISEVLSSPQYDAYYIKRMTSFCGSFIRHGSWYPDKQCRLWQKSKGSWQGLIHEGWRLEQSAGRYGTLGGDLLHYSFDTISDYLRMIDKYTTLSAEDAFRKGKRCSLAKLIFGPAIKFFRDYILGLGFLDGYAGFVAYRLGGLRSFCQVQQDQGQVPTTITFSNNYMNKTVLITGSTSGIGLATAKLFASKGYNVAFNGLEPDGAAIAAEVAATYNVQHIFSPANMLDAHAIKAFVQETIKTLGGIDVLINNAGIQFVSPVEDFPEDKWNDILSINLTAAFIATKEAWPAMKAAGFGRVINVSSAHGLIASAFKSAYVAAKHGIVGFTKVMALEGGPFGITCNAVCPGYVHTPIVEKQIGAQMQAHNMSREEVIAKVMLSEHAIKEFIPVETIAETIFFLADSAAGATITGIAMPVDAGWTAH